MGDADGPFADVGCGVAALVEAAAASFAFADSSTAASFFESGTATCAPPPWMFEASEGNGGLGIEGLTFGASFVTAGTGLAGCNYTIVSFCILYIR